MNMKNLARVAMVLAMVGGMLAGAALGYSGKST